MTHPDFDLLEYPYPSKRTATVANNGMVATSQPLAAQAGLDILKKGGNAVDAAIATAATLTVVEPTTNGIGGDAFALVWMKDKLYGLNGSGPSPKNISIEKVKEAGHEKMPTYGWTPVTVPGEPASWAKLSDRFGKLPLIDVLEPAIKYAETGYPISPILGQFWKVAYDKMKENLKGEEFKPWFDTFAPNGRAPKIGEVWSSKGHAETLRKIGETKARDFYEGDLANQIDAFSRKYKGYLRKEDLASYKPEWVEPISVNYRGYEVWEIPPNGQGLLALIALNIFKNFEIPAQASTESYHKQIEAIKLAFSLTKNKITDNNFSALDIEELLSDLYGETTSQRITNEAITPASGEIPKGGTVYLATADNEGNMVSYIQSNYRGFGSGIVIPDTGIALQNRGEDFSLNPEDPNALEGGKRTFHTIIPGFLTKDRKPIGPFGVMGGPMQPQAHLQVISNLIDYHLNPQATIDTPRWQWMDNKNVLVEHGFPKHIAEGLSRMGHQVKYDMGAATFGRGQIIWRDQETGTYFGGTDGRTDSSIASY
ncbi:gamma-glutamyltransferase [Carnobacteriaceae bacterium 52-44]